MLDKRKKSWYNKVIFNIGRVRFFALDHAFKMQGEKMERIKISPHVAGLKQTKKAVEAGNARVVFIARDADSHVVMPLEKMCEGKEIEVVYVNNMKELAKASHIDVPTAVVTIVKSA